MIKTKVCGITKIEDAIIAENYGAFAIGFIFYEKSPRYINPEKAKKIANSVKIKTVGVFVNENSSKINEIAEFINLDYVQLHGLEKPEECDKLIKPYIKNIREISDIEKYKNAEIFLTDAPNINQWGGTGQLADWNFANKIKNAGKPLMLSGGLSINNIKSAIKTVNPDFIDVSSSLEISHGVKNPKLIKKFFEELKNMETK